MSPFKALLASSLLLAADEPVKPLKFSHGAHVLCVAISPDGKTAVSGGIDGRVIQYDLTAGEIIRTVTVHCNAVSRVIYSPDGKRIGSVSCKHSSPIIVFPLGTT